ncbi:hypothetical protein IJT17_09310 [bacterium]|nr:hypothetical protein [bacterium]
MQRFASARRWPLSLALLGMLSVGSGLVAGCTDKDRDIESNNNPHPAPTVSPTPSPEPTPIVKTISFRIANATAPWGLDHGYSLSDCAFHVRLTAIDDGEEKEYTEADGLTITALEDTLGGEGYYSTNASVTYVVSGVPDAATAPEDDQQFTLTSLTVRSEFGYQDDFSEIQEVESDIEWLDYDGGTIVHDGDTLSATDNAFAGGSGTEDDPYLVSNPRQFNNLRDNSDKCFEQTCAIDFDISVDISGIGTTGGWVPIPEFSGTYDGGEHSLINLFPMSLDDQNWALIKRLKGATISNLTIGPLLYDVTTAQQVGILALYASDAPVTLSNCVNSADLATIYSDNIGAGDIAGLIFNCTTDLTLENCHNSGSLETEKGVNNGHISGLLGSFENGSSLTVTGCSNTGDLSGTSVAGLVGSVYSLDNAALSVKDCSNSGTISGTAAAGGLFRDIEIDAIEEFSSCENTGDVNASGIAGECYVGGIIGKLGSTAEPTISTCQNSGAVSMDSVTNSGNLGGLLGTNNAVLTVENSASTGSVTIGEMVSGTGCAGGLVGFSSTNSSVTFTDCEEPAMPTITSDQGGTSYLDTFLGYQQ